MKNLLLLTIFILSSFSILLNGQSEQIIIPCIINNEQTDLEQDLGQLGHRAPVRPITVTISQEQGVDVPDLDKQDFISYSIYNEDKLCICSVNDESSFIETLFSLSGIYEIKLDTYEFSLRGWIQID